MRNYAVGQEPVPGYRLVRFLGQGGFGQVWEAKGPGGVDVALKVISLEGSEGLKEFRAIGLVKKLHNPNLVPLHGYWLRDEYGHLMDADHQDSLNLRGKSKELIIAMGLGEKSLAQRLEECKRSGLPGIPVDELLDHMAGAARAIDYLNQPTHSLDSGPPAAIQHCDIKPGNLLIVGNGLQVCDYGLARALTTDIRTTQSSGTPAYCAPELFVNKPSRWTDQYSLAITYYELRTGRLPFSEAEAIQAHILGNLDLALLPPTEREVIRKATHLRPDQRYPQTIDMVRALRDAISQGQRPTPGSGVFGGPPQPPAQSIDELIRPGYELVPGYKLVRLLGRGGYGEVWEARGPGGKRCALKIVRNLDAAQGKQEFRSLDLIRDLDHDRLISLQAYWILSADGTIIPDEQIGQPGAPASHALVMATDLAAKNLLNRLAEYTSRGEPGIPPAELIRYMIQVAEAIDYLNAHAIQHRDIKPENVLLTKDGRVKVSDFGLAKLVEGTAAQVHSASVGLTAAYAAPELFRNTVTKWTDQYSLALTYYKLRTGRWPFPADSGPFQIMQAHAEGRLDFSDVPEEERRVLAKATAVEPAARYGSCQEMVDELRKALGITEIPASVPSLPIIPAEPAQPTIRSEVLAAALPGRPVPEPTPSSETSMHVAAEESGPWPYKEAGVPRAVAVTPSDGTLNFVPGPTPPRPVVTTPSAALADTDFTVPSKAHRPAEPVAEARPDEWKKPASKRGKVGAILAGMALLLGVASAGGYYLLTHKSEDKRDGPGPKDDPNKVAIVPSTPGSGQQPSGPDKVETDRFTTALDRARQALAARNFSASRTALAEAERHALTESQKQQWQSVKALALAVDPSANDAETAEAVDLFQRLLGRPEAAPELSALARAYADLATRRPALRDEARPVLERVQSRLTGDDGRVVVERIASWKPTATEVRPDRAVDEELAAIERVLAGKPAADQAQRLRGQLQAAAGRMNQAPDPTGQRARKLEALTVWRDALDPATKSAARPRLVKLLLADRVYQPAQLCRVFFQQYGSAPDALADARQVREKTLSRSVSEVSSGDKREVNKAYQDLLTAYAKQQIAAPAPDWEALLHDLADADANNAWAQAAKAEALCSRDGKAPAGPDLESARQAVAAVEPELGPYGKYVLGLLYATDDPPRAANDMMTAYRGEVAPLLDLERRAKRAAAVLRNAALAVRQAPQLLELPYRPADAQAVVDWLQKASALAAGRGDPRWAGLLALAAWQAGDKALAGRMIRDVTPANVGTLKEDAGAALLVRAWATEGDAARVQAFADFLAREIPVYATNADSEDPTGAKGGKLLSEVIQPALDAGAKLGVTPQSDDALRRALARAFASKGRVMNVNIASFTARIPEIVAAYTEAIRLADPAPAEYYVGRGFARFYAIYVTPTPEKKKEWPEVEADAKRAFERDKDYYETYTLLAVIRQFEDELHIPPELRAEGDHLDHMRQAAGYYAKAIELCKDSSKPTLLYNRSKLMLELANDSGIDSVAERKRLLEEGLANAQDAIKDNFRNIHKAWNARGCLLEDLAWQVGEVAKFDEAITEFKRGAELARGKKEKDEGKYWTDLGRCQFRAAEYGRRGDKLARDAVVALKTATGLKGTHLAEAQYWLGRAEGALRQYDPADAALRAAATAAGTGPWKARALAAQSALAIEQAQRDKARATALLNAAKSAADELQKLGSPHDLTAQVLKGQADEAAGDAKQAELHYRWVRETEEKAGRKADAAYIEALACELRLHLDPRWGLEPLPPKTLAGRAREVKAFLDRNAWLLSARAAAEAYAAAGQALVAAADPLSAEEQALRTEAKDCYQRAVELSAAQDPRSARWRYLLAADMEKLLPSHPEYRAEALRLAKEAADYAGSRDEARDAQELMRRLGK